MNLRKLYFALIEKANKENGKPTSQRDTKPGYENHHIIPRSQGGANHNENLVRFTHKQHALAHKILPYLYGETMAHVWDSMSCNGTRNCRQIAEVRHRAQLNGIKHREKYGVHGKKPKPALTIEQKYGFSCFTNKTGYQGVTSYNTLEGEKFYFEIKNNKEKFCFRSYETPKQAAIDYDICILQIKEPDYPRNFPDLNLIDLRRLNYSLRTFQKPAKVKKVKQLKGRTWSEERKAAARGRVVSDETRKKMSESRKGQKHSPETIEKLSISHKGNQNGKGNKGKLWSEERKQTAKERIRSMPDVTCPHCGTTGKPYVINKSHFENCKHLRDQGRTDKAPCMHCGKLYGLQYLLTHVDNCKKKPPESTETAAMWF